MLSVSMTSSVRRAEIASPGARRECRTARHGAAVSGSAEVANGLRFQKRCFAREHSPAIDFSADAAQVVEIKPFHVSGYT